MRKQAVFTETEEKGYHVFTQKCSSCHKEPLFTDNSFRNNGLSISMIDDVGRYAVTLQDSDKYKFKVPGLRNLSFTQPYMHDGRLLTLEGVLDHYTEGMQYTPNLDKEFTRNGKAGVELTDEEKQDILAFLKALDDRSFVTDRMLAQ